VIEHIGAGYGREGKPEEQREQGEGLADWLEQLIEDERHTYIASAHDQLGDAAERI